MLAVDVAILDVAALCSVGSRAGSGRAGGCGGSGSPFPCAAVNDLPGGLDRREHNRRRKCPQSLPPLGRAGKDLGALRARTRALILLLFFV